MNATGNTNRLSHATLLRQLYATLVVCAMSALPQTGQAAVDLPPLHETRPTVAVRALSEVPTAANDVFALHSLYNATNGSAWLTPWDVATDPCVPAAEWFGITCALTTLPDGTDAHIVT